MTEYVPILSDPILFLIPNKSQRSFIRLLYQSFLFLYLLTSHRDQGFDFSFTWLHFGWLNLRAFPSRYLFYWGANFPLPSLGMQAIEPGQLVRDKEDMPLGWDRKTTLRMYDSIKAFICS